MSNKTLVGLDITNGLHVGVDDSCVTKMTNLDGLIKGMSSIKENEYLAAELDEFDLQELKEFCESNNYEFI